MLPRAESRRVQCGLRAEVDHPLPFFGKLGFASEDAGLLSAKLPVAPVELGRSAIESLGSADELQLPLIGCLLSLGHLVVKLGDPRERLADLRRQRIQQAVQARITLAR